MPITDLGSYLPTMDEFVAHWTQLNAYLTCHGLDTAILRDGCTLADFSASRIALSGLIRLAQQAREQETHLRAERDYHAEEIRGQILLFQAAIMKERPGTPEATWLAQCSLADPTKRSYLGLSSRIIAVWQELHSQGIAPSFARPDQFQTEVQCLQATSRALRQARRVLEATEEDLRRSRQLVMKRLMNYRTMVRFELAVDDALLHSLPARTPESGRPGPVVNGSQAGNSVRATRA